MWHLYATFIVRTWGGVNKEPDYRGQGRQLNDFGSVVQQKNKPDSTASPSESAQRIYRIAAPLGTSGSLLKRFEPLSQFHFLSPGEYHQADVMLIDARQHLNEKLSNDTEFSNMLSATELLPALVVVGDNSAPHELFSGAQASMDPQRVELLSESEIGSNLPLARLTLLLQRNQVQAHSGVLQKNAHIVLEAVMQYSNDWMVLKSLDHRFLMVSRNFCEAYGKPAHELLGKNDLEIGTSRELVLGKPGTDWKGYWELDKAVTDTGERVVLQPLVLADSETEEIRESTDKVPLKDEDGNVFGLLVCVSELEQKIGQESVERRLGGRTWERKKNLSRSPALMELNNERKQAETLQQESERAVIAKNRFIAAASHDLRQPLHALGLYMGALEGRVDSDARELVKKIKNCIGSLNDLLTSLLDISRLDANVVSAKYNSFPLEDLLTSLHEECSNIARDKSLELNCHTDNSQVYSDPILLRRIVRNLIINSINHTVEGKVSLTAQRIRNRVELVIIDTGVGIPYEKQKAVFEEFTKLEAKSGTSSDGLGLGLSIVKRLCLLLDISLELSSTPDVGTRMTLLIPLGRNAVIKNDNSVAMPEEVANAGDRHGVDDWRKGDRLIVVIDDDLEVCKAVEIMLKRCGYKVVSATTTDSAISLLRQKQLVPDAVLVDFRLAQGFTGIDAIRQLNEEFECSLPALIVTGDTSDTGLREITRSRYNYLHKPVEADYLVAAIDSIFDSEKGDSKLGL